MTIGFEDVAVALYQLFSAGQCQVLKDFSEEVLPVLLDLRNDSLALIAQGNLYDSLVIRRSPFLKISHAY